MMFGIDLKKDEWAFQDFFFKLYIVNKEKKRKA